MRVRTAIWQPIEYVKHPGSTNPCEIAEFCWRPCWKQPFFDVCYFSEYFTCLLIIRIETDCTGCVVFLHHCIVLWVLDIPYLYDSLLCFDNARPWISGIQTTLRSFGYNSLCRILNQVSFLQYNVHKISQLAL